MAEVMHLAVFDGWKTMKARDICSFAGARVVFEFKTNAAGKIASARRRRARLG
jgi:hypothetical protein